MLVYDVEYDRQPSYRSDSVVDMFRCCQLWSLVEESNGICECVRCVYVGLCTLKTITKLYAILQRD